MSWKHEWPLEEEAADDPAPVLANPSVNGTHEAEEAPTRRIFGSPSPVVPNHRQTSGIMNMTQQGPSAEFCSARLENRDATRSPSASNSPRRHIAGKQDLRPTTGQALRSKGKIPSHKDGQPQPVASASLGPVDSSKVSKATQKKRPGPQQQPNTSQEMSSGDPPFLSGSDIAEPLPQAASIYPRRSKRLEPPEPNTAKGRTGITSTDSTKVITRSRPKRNGAGNPKSIGSAKPQGVSKKQCSSRARGKARKDGS
jgi:hypothetical protein